MQINSKVISIVLIFLAIVSSASGLSLTASSGNNHDSSSTQLVFGTTVDDYINGQIQLNSIDSTLSNTISGTGSLPKAYIDINDGNGNYASVFRSVSGKAKTTKWSFGWNTYNDNNAGVPGVGAWLSLTASNAYSISGGSYSSNRYEAANVRTDVGLFNSKGTTSSLSNYYTEAHATNYGVIAVQSADDIKCAYPIYSFDGLASNAKDGYATVDIAAQSGEIKKAKMTAYADDTVKWVDCSASNVITQGATGQPGNFRAWASSNGGTIADFNLNVEKGNVNNPYLYARSETDEAYSFGETGSTSGNPIDLKASAQNTRYAYEYLSYPDHTDIVDTYHGGADFEVKAKSLKYSMVETIATQDNVLITPVLPDNIKTAILLEPFRYSDSTVGITDLGTTVFPTLVKSGYATLRYTDSGASFDKYQNWGKYNVVVADGHGSPNSISLSTSPYSISASDLDYETKKKTLVILTMCEGFSGYPSQKSGLASALSGASLCGGFAYSVGTAWADDYISYFFDALSKGNTASKANTIAHNAVNKKYGRDSIPNGNVPLVFYGDQKFKL